jgi:TRAP-type C4-dicarboxylate transport system permease small subunit
LIGRLDRGLAAIAAVAMALVLPLSLLLFLQWPLREWVQRGSREANDLAQIAFALYVAVAVSYASRRRTHLAADLLAHRYPLKLRLRLERAAALVVALPWAIFLLYAGWSALVQSVGQMESFPETYNPGYFLLRVAVTLLAVLVAAQAVSDLFRRPS